MVIFLKKELSQINDRSLSVLMQLESGMKDGSKKTLPSMPKSLPRNEVGIVVY